MGLNLHLPATSFFSTAGGTRRWKIRPSTPHRIGAAGPVTVTRFLVLGTIEERINAVLKEKREIFEMIFSGAEHRRNMKLTQQQIFGLFDLKCPGGPLTAAA